MALITKVELAALEMKRSFQLQEYLWRVGGNSDDNFKI
jgi:hypothetical protein